METLVGFIFLVVMALVALAYYSHVAEPPQEGAARTRPQTAFDSSIEVAISIACSRGWVSRYTLTQRGLGKFEAVMILDTARSRGLLNYNPSNRRYYPTNEARRFRQSTLTELTEAKHWRERNISLAMEIANSQGWVSVRSLTNKRNYDARVRQRNQPFLTDGEAQEVLKDACARGMLRETNSDCYELQEGNKARQNDH